MFPVLGRQLLRYRAGEEEDDDDSGSNPEGAVQVRVPVERVEEGRRVGEEGDESGAAPVEDGAGVDVEKLRVEGEGPEHAFGGCRGGVVGEIGGVGCRGEEGCVV